MRFATIIFTVATVLYFSRSFLNIPSEQIEDLGKTTIQTGIEN